MKNKKVNSKPLDNSKNNQPVNKELEELKRKTIGLIVFCSVSIVLVTILYLIYNICYM
jgi:hypothetical protein